MPGSNLRDGSLGSNHRAMFARRGGDRVGHGAHSPAHKSPKASMAVHTPHAVVQQNISGTGRSGASIRADHSVGGQRHLHLFGFEPFVQKIRGALSEDSY